MQTDQAYLLDILLASRRALSHIEGMSWRLFVDSHLHQDAVLRSLEVIGEAARLVSKETQDQYPQIPWGKMIGMRNILIHDYSHIDLEIVWDTIQRDLPDLVVLLGSIISPDQ